MIVKTLVSRYVAKEGYKFLFSGPMTECLSCRFKYACVDNLREGVAYEVVKVYRVINKCPVLGEVVTVDVKPAEVDVALDPKAAIEGAVVTYTHQNCGAPCRYGELCRNPLVRSKTKVKVVSVGGRITCRTNKNLVKATVIVWLSSSA
ncbi:MAG: UPF0179 family protein [Sulfolobales archaeon]